MQPCEDNLHWNQNLNQILTNIQSKKQTAYFSCHIAFFEIETKLIFDYLFNTFDRQEIELEMIWN